MDILQALNDLSKEKLGKVLLELSSSPDIGEEITSATDLHDVDNVRFSVK